MSHKKELLRRLWVDTTNPQLLKLGVPASRKLAANGMEVRGTRPWGLAGRVLRFGVIGFRE